MKQWFFLIIAALVIVSGTAQSQTTLFWDARIPETTEFTGGFFETDNAIGDYMTIPLRLELPYSRDISWFVQANYHKIDTIIAGVDLDTFSIGGGFSYMFMDENGNDPLNVSTRAGVTYMFEADDDLIKVDSDFIVEGAVGISKTFPVSSIVWVPYANGTLGYSAEESDTSITAGLGSRLMLTERFSMFAEIDLGDRDGFAIGASYLF